MIINDIILNIFNVLKITSPNKIRNILQGVQAYAIV